MIEINLLPEELRKKESALKKIDIMAAVLRNVSFAKFAVIIFAALALVHILLFTFGMVNKMKFEAFSEKRKLLGDGEKDAMALKLKSDIMNEKKAAIDQLMVKRFEWSNKLNDLSDSLTAGIWLSELSYNERDVEMPGQKARDDESGTAGGKEKARAPDKRTLKYMTISGYAASKGEEGTASIGKFIKALKANEGFYRDFSDIELGSIKRDKIEGQDVMSFSITCLFAETK